MSAMTMIAAATAMTYNRKRNAAASERNGFSTAQMM